MRVRSRRSGAPASRRRLLSAADYRHLLDAVNIIVWRADARTFQTTFASSQAEAMLGYPVSMWTDVPNFWIDHLHRDDRDRVVELSAAAVAAARNHDFEYRMIAADGRVVWLRNIVTVIVEKGRPAELIGATAEVTQRKEAEEEALRLREQLTRLTRVTALGEMATALAHELNQPLGAIASNAESAELLLAERAEPRDLAAVLGDIRFDAHRAGEIIRSVQSLVQHEAVPTAPLHLAEVFGTVAAMLKSVLAARGIVIESEIAPDLPLVDASATELQQLFYNLVLNAIDALSSVTRRTRRIRVTARRLNGSRVEVAIEDNGPGIDPAVLPHVFDSFFSTKPGGMGVGLAMCRRIVEVLGGEIRAENVRDGGARLRFTLRASTRKGAAA